MDDLEADLWSLAAGMASRSGLWVDGAIAVAESMVSSGDSRPQAIAVAALPRGTRQAEALGPVTELLASCGVATVTETASEVEKFDVIKDAFAHGGIAVEQFEGEWYVQLPEYTRQSLLQRQVTQLLDQRDHETSPTGRQALANRIRQLLRD